MEFKPRRSNKTGRELLVLGGAFLIFSAGVFFLADKTAGFALAGVSILLLAVIVFETGRFGWSYSVDDEGIEIKRTFKRYFIAKDNIESVKEISREQADKIISSLKREGSQEPRKKKQSSVSLQIQLGRLIGFSSIPINISEHGPAARQSRPSGKYMTERFVLLGRKDGKQYILTPADTKAFLQECRKMKAR